MWGNTYLNTLQLEDGFVSPPNEPGLGIELNYEALNPHRVI
jgi:L-alanine-DL-glutamate epimerase-like enolase superfamily enzyme